MSPLEAKQESLKRRKQLRLKVFTLKIDNKSIKENKLYFKMLFLEAKWLYNYLLSQKNIFNINVTYIKSVQVKIKYKFEEREIKYLTYAMKQKIHEQVKENIKALSKAKKKDLKVGKLKFTSEINTIILKNFKQLFKFENNKLFMPQSGRFKNSIKPTSLKIHGLSQLNGTLEIGCAYLVRKPSGIYLKITTYWEKEKIIHKETLGIDFNVSNTLVISNGQQINKIQIKESKRLKKLQKHQNKKVKGSNNRFKHNKLIAKEYEKLSNQKEDISNKIVNKLKDYQLVIQNDSLQSWHKDSDLSSQIQHSILGRIKSKLISLETTKVVGQYERTANTCFNCETRLHLRRGQKKFKCTKCGFEYNRDLNAAKNIMKIGMECSEFTPLESCIDFSSIYGIEVETLKKENNLKN